MRSERVRHGVQAVGLLEADHQVHVLHGLHVRGTNFCDIGWTIDPGSGRLILMSAIDNLVKGAAGQAVQNMNLMVGFQETDGLDAVPYPL